MTFSGGKHKIGNHGILELAMNVTLTPELETLIAAEVKAGRSSNPDEFLNKAVYHYVVARDLGQEYTQMEIDRMISEGLDDIDRGDTIEGDEAFRGLRAYSAERRQFRA
jgi:Arc/MetJ-type ribon-helix-helix transcriptional regulator